MTIGISSFKYQMPGVATSVTKTVAHAILEGLKSAFLACHENWTLESDIECMGDFTESNYNPKSTFQIQNTVTGEHVRVWFITGKNSTSGNTSSSTQAGVVSSDTPQSSGDANVSYFNTNNLNVMKANGGNRFYAFSNVIFGVSESSIGKDFGYSLQLKIPLFSITIDTENSFTSNVVISNILYSHGNAICKFSIISDGDGFIVVGHMGDGAADSSFGCTYSRNMLTTRSGDEYTAAAITFGGGGFSYGSAPNSKYAIYANDSGSFDYGQYCMVGIIDLLNYTSESSVVLACSPLICGTCPFPYLSNNTELVSNGIGYKGSTNMNYIRFTSVNATTAGVAYGNNSWLCIGVGILVPWAPEHDADSPFVLS